MSSDFVSDFIPVEMSGWIQVWQACSLLPQSHQCNMKKFLSRNPSLLIIYFCFLFYNGVVPLIVMFPLKIVI